MRLFKKPEASVLMVCTANICRSPMAEGLLVAELRSRGWGRRIKVDSAGTHAAQPNRAADPRAKRILQREGIDISKCRARQVQRADFEKFDYILAMDGSNYRWLMQNSEETSSAQVSLIGEWSRTKQHPEIPDPYFGNLEGFETVLTMLRHSISGFLLSFDDE